MIGVDAHKHSHTLVAVDEEDVGQSGQVAAQVLDQLQPISVAGRTGAFGEKPRSHLARLLAQRSDVTLDTESG